jgi:hypothetical protein
MDAAEIAWRLKTGRRAAIDRAATALVKPRWNRAHLASALAPLPGLSPARAALAGHDWHEAHRGLSRYFAHASQQFVVGHATRSLLVERIRLTFPDSARQAAARADRILAGEYDVLGYRGLRFDPVVSGAGRHGRIDWHLDPVHGRRAPRTFWSTVPYLEPPCGDHKIIWELNRHQHWLTLGRAYWLTGDAKYRDRFVAELTSWIDANPPLVGINWASMLELALRSISWLWALSFFVEDPERAERDGHTADRAPWVVDLLLGLDRQLTHIEHNLSYYFSPNTHLSGEALALYVSGLALPELAASARRADVGRRVLLTQIDRQIASDGGHRERSTHYHRYTLDFYLLALIVARIHRDPAAAEFERAVSRLGFAARLLADDRGQIPHIGDDDGGALLPMTGRAPDDLRDSLAVAAALVDRPDLSVGQVPEEAFWLLGHERFATSDAASPSSSDAPRAGLSSGALVETGYYVSRNATSDHLVIDGGLHGYQNGGHAHADALSLTFSVGGVPLLIDPGTACYTADRQLRDRFRSTALHNTLTIDNRPQSVSNGPFHWSHTANSRVRRWRTNQAFDYFDGAHDGYQPTTHRRCVLALHGDLLIVADLVDGSGVHTAALHWHVDPRWTVAVRGTRATFTGERTCVHLIVPQGAIESFTADAVSGLGWHSPMYGRVEPATTLRVTRAGTAPLWMVSVFDLNSENPVGYVEWVPVWSEAGAIARAVGIRITRAVSRDYLLIAEPAAGLTTSAPTCRIGEIETDARMLFYRSTAKRSVSRLALVDGSMVCVAGEGGCQLDLHDIMPDYFTDFATSSAALHRGPQRGSRVGVESCPAPAGRPERPALREAAAKDQRRTTNDERLKTNDQRLKDHSSCAG